MNSAEKGQFGGHTDAENSADAAIRSVLGEVQTDPMLPGLVDDVPDDFDVLGKVAETLNAKRRARGRPEGSANRRNAEVFDYLEARGFKAPELRLMEINSADPRQLAAALSGPDVKPENVSFDRVMEVLKLQAKVASDLLPYKFAKRQELQVSHTGEVAHVMMAGRLVAPGEGLVKEWSLTGEATEISNEINITPNAVSQE
jgi:hypothetical protein